MAEFKEFHCPYGDDFEGGDECDRCEQYELCMETPTADVVERSKIDKAIKEMEKLKKNVATTEDFYAKLCVRECIVILKKNIGE